MMTVRQWLAQNLTTRDGYTEAHMYDASGNICMFWYGDADPKYDAHVLRVEDADAWHISANVYTDYVESDR